MKAILDRLDFVTTWLLITLGVGVFITGFGFGAVVADKTTDKPFRNRAMRDTNATGVCIIYLFDNWTKTNRFGMTVENISNPCNFSTNRHADSTATNMILRVSHEPIVRRASNAWEITFKE